MESKEMRSQDNQRAERQSRFVAASLPFTMVLDGAGFSRLPGKVIHRGILNRIQGILTKAVPEKLKKAAGLCCFKKEGMEDVQGKHLF